MLACSRSTLVSVSLSLLALTACVSSGNGGPSAASACKGPFVEIVSNDSCDSLSDRWDIRDADTVEECFALCGQSAECRRDAIVRFNESKGRCILNASCSPNVLGYVDYQAEMGCELQQCWSTTPAAVPPCGEPNPFSGGSAVSLDECIQQCEIDGDDCPKVIQFNETTGDCIHRNITCHYDGFEALEYEEVACGNAD